MSNTSTDLVGGLVEFRIQTLALPLIRDFPLFLRSELKLSLTNDVGDGDGDGDADGTVSQSGSPSLCVLAPHVLVSMGIQITVVIINIKRRSRTEAVHVVDEDDD